MLESNENPNQTAGNTPENPNQTSGNTPEELTIQLANLLRNSLGLQSTHNTESISIGFKLSGDNYPLWDVLMKKAIGGRGKTSYITGVPSPPPTNDPAYRKWEQEDQCVFTWLIQNIEPSLINSVSKHLTAKAVWDGLALTYGSGTDSLQVFDLHRKANTLKQGDGMLEEIWAKLQDIWMTIDRKEPNPMECSKDIEVYNRIIQNQRLYQFLTALSDKYEPVKKEILKREPLPSVDMAYAMVRRETARDQILRPIVVDGDTSSGIGLGLAARDKHRFGQPPQKGNWPRRTEEEKSKLVCSHCGMKKHTKESCFQLVGYPDWWDETKRTKLPTNNRTKGSNSVAAVVNTDQATNAVAGNTKSAGDGATETIAGNGGNDLGEFFNFNSPNAPPILREHGRSPISPCFLQNNPLSIYGNTKTASVQVNNCFQALKNISTACTVPVPSNEKNEQWIFDCGATDTMTLTPLILSSLPHPGKLMFRLLMENWLQSRGLGLLPYLPL